MWLLRTQDRAEEKGRPCLVAGGFTDHSSKELGLEVPCGEQPPHRIGIGVLSWLPVTPGVAALILVHFVRELHVPRVCLGQQAVGEA